jgi:hypothetical protein
MGSNPMKIPATLLAAALACAAPLSQALEQSELDLLIKRLAEVETQQAQTQQVIADLRRQIEQAGAGGTSREARVLAEKVIQPEP